MHYGLREPDARLQRNGRAKPQAQKGAKASLPCCLQADIFCGGKGGGERERRRGVARSLFLEICHSGLEWITHHPPYDGMMGVGWVVLHSRCTPTAPEQGDWRTQSRLLLFLPRNSFSVSLLRQPKLPCGKLRRPGRDLAHLPATQCIVVSSLGAVSGRALHV